MRTVRFNVLMTPQDAQAMDGLMMRANAHDMPIHGRVYQSRTLLFRSHHRVSTEGRLCVEEVVLGYLDADFPAHKRMAFPVADLHLLLEEMPVPNVALPEDDAGQAEVMQDDPHCGDEAVEPLSGADVRERETEAQADEGDHDGPECDGAGDHGAGSDLAADREADGSAGAAGRHRIGSAVE